MMAPEVGIATMTIYPPLLSRAPFRAPPHTAATTLMEIMSIMSILSAQLYFSSSFCCWFCSSVPLFSPTIHKHTHIAYSHISEILGRVGVGLTVSGGLFFFVGTVFFLVHLSFASHRGMSFISKALIRGWEVGGLGWQAVLRTHARTHSLWC